MADTDVSLMYIAVRNTVIEIVGTGIKVKGGYQNVAQPTDRDELGKPKETYLVIPDIPTAGSTGHSDVGEWVESSAGSVEGSLSVREDFEAIFSMHQIGGRGELLQKIKASLELDSIIAFMNTLGLVCRRHGQTIPMYNTVNDRWGPDCMAEFTFAGSYRLTENVNKITDVKYTLNTN